MYKLEVKVVGSDREIVWIDWDVFFVVQVFEGSSHQLISDGKTAFQILAPGKVRDRYLIAHGYAEHAYAACRVEAST